MKERRTLLLPCLATIAGAIALMLIMLQVQPTLVELAGHNGLLFSFAPEWIEGMANGSIFYRVMWLIGDLTEGAFYKNVVASLFMVVGVCVAFYLEKKESKYAGTGVGGMHKIFGSIVAAQLLGLALTILLWGGFAKTVGWIPTFVPMCCVAPPIVLAFGKGFSKIVTAAVLAALVPFPLAYMFMMNITNPLKLPGFCGVALGMCLSTALTTELCRVLPWMKKDTSQPEQVPAPRPKTTLHLYVDRLFADSSELIFWGSSLAGMCMYLGGFVSWLLNPMHTNYGSGSFPVMICVQFCTGALSILFWVPAYRRDGFCFTFSALIFTSAIVNTYPANWVVLVPTVLVGCVMTPAIVHWVLRKFPIFGRWHGSVAVQLCASLSCSAWSFVVMYVLMPLAG